MNVPSLSVNTVKINNSLPNLGYETEICLTVTKSPPVTIVMGTEQTTKNTWSYSHCLRNVT